MLSIIGGNTSFLFNFNMYCLLYYKATYLYVSYFEIQIHKCLSPLLLYPISSIGISRSLKLDFKGYYFLYCKEFLVKKQHNRVRHYILVTVSDVVNDRGHFIV